MEIVMKRRKFLHALSVGAIALALPLGKQEREIFTAEKIRELKKFMESKKVRPYTLPDGNDCYFLVVPPSQYLSAKQKEHLGVIVLDGGRDLKEQVMEIKKERESCV